MTYVDDDIVRYVTRRLGERPMARVSQLTTECDTRAQRVISSECLTIQLSPIGYTHRYPADRPGPSSKFTTAVPS